MKSYIPYSLLLAVAACGFQQAKAVTATTTPIGYETLPVAAGFNFLGIRLHQPIVAAGLLTAVTSTSISDTNTGHTDFTTLASGTTYILEIKNANGVTQEFLGSAVTSSSQITTPDLTAVAAVGDAYVIRAAPTLASTFGAANSAGLDTGFFGPGGDLILLPNPATPGGFDQYYYDSGQTSWADINGNPVDGTTIAWNYADSMIISASGAGSDITNGITVTGEVKIGVKDSSGNPVANTGGTSYSLTGNSLNFLSSVSPVGATLASAFNGALGTIDQGFFGPGGYIFYIVNPATPGGFDQYYYDGGQSSWADINGNPIDATTVNLTAGILIYDDAASASLVNSPPSSYSSL